MTSTTSIFYSVLFLLLGIASVLLLELVITYSSHRLTTPFLEIVNTCSKCDTMEIDTVLTDSLSDSSLVFDSPPVSFSREEADSKIHGRGDPWFEDGNVVLVASQTSFKVHRGVLAKHSDVFQGLFNIPQPEDAEKYEGVPVIKMTDNPDDVSVFLAALYDGPRYAGYIISIGCAPH